MPSKWSIVCAITNSTVDIVRRAAGQINTSIFILLIQTTQTWSLPLGYPMITAAVDLMVGLPYIAAELITSSRFTCDEVLPSKWPIACAITNSAVDIGRRAVEQINTSSCRLLIETTQTWSLPLPRSIITVAVDLMIDQQQPTSPLNQYFLPFSHGARVAVEMVYCMPTPIRLSTSLEEQHGR